eukprot:TRINITY_DN1450_c0_g1_i1.p1 TRINITY_DN1450_c0_g1~~TRINITY_DN1450_c0_g1_i1.p1  ORF type:complete len:174 (-),score=12.46 TRINITY_DN1450_c0_g1_i1:135-656(-)
MELGWTALRKEFLFAIFIAILCTGGEFLPAVENQNGNVSVIPTYTKQSDTVHPTEQKSTTTIHIPAEVYNISTPCTENDSVIHWIYFESQAKTLTTTTNLSSYSFEGETPQYNLSPDDTSKWLIYISAALRSFAMLGIILWGLTLHLDTQEISDRIERSPAIIPSVIQQVSIP